MRHGLWIAALALMGCGGGNDKDDSGSGGKSPGANCGYTGATDGCLIANNDDCTGNSALSGLEGGWFNDDDDLTIGIAPTGAGMEITMTVANPVGLASAAEYLVPTDVLVEMFDTSGAEPVQYYACPGQLRITNYEPGDLMWGNFGFQARSPTGLCGQADYYTLQGEFINLEYCADG